MEQDQSAAVGGADSGTAGFDFATGNPPSSAVTGGTDVAADGGAQAPDASAYQAVHTALNGTAGDMANYQSTGAAANGEAVTNGMGEPVPEPSYEEAVLSAEEARLWSVVAVNSLDFNAWTALIEETEKNAENNILKIRKVYDSFLAEFPLCFGYWKKYADHEARLDGVSKVIEVYERAVLAVTYSVDIWYNYCQFAISTYDDPDIIRRLFERGLAYVGTDYRSNILWDEYIKYEESLEAWSHLAVIYTRILEHPIQQIDRYFNWQEARLFETSSSLAALASFSRVEVEPGGRQANRQSNAKPFESMETSEATPTRPPHPTAASPSPSPSSSLSLRLWRPRAQRNVRNQWSHLKAAKDQWLDAAADGRSHASALVNTHISRWNMPATDLGVLKDMPGIRDKANSKLARREEQYSGMLLSAYKEMVRQLSYLVKASHSMRCFSNATPNGAIMQFSDCQDDLNDSGDGGGAPVFKWFSILEFENLAHELVEMFVSEQKLKRLLLLGFLSITSNEGIEHQTSLDWGVELYDGESNELQSIGLQSGDTYQLPEDWSADILGSQLPGNTPSHEVLQVFHRQPRKNVQMDVGCFNNIIGKLCENGMLAEAEKLFEEMETKSVLPDVYTYTYLVDSCFKEGRVEDTMQYFYKMADGREPGPKFNIGFFNRMFEGLTEAGRIDDALKVYGRMPDKEIKPNTTTFEILVKALCKEGNLDQARGLVVDMARGGIVPPPEFREYVVDFFKKADRQEEIEKAFEEKPMPTPQPRTEHQLRNQYRSHNAVGAAQANQPGFSSAPAVKPGFVYSQPQQSTFSNNQSQQSEFGSSHSWNSGFGAPQPHPGYGASQPVVGSSYSQPQQTTFSYNQNQRPEFGSSHSYYNSGFGAPQAQPGYGAPQPVQAVASSSQLQRPQFGASQGVPGYSNIGNQHGQFGSPHGEPKFSNHSPQVGYGAQLPQSGYCFEPQQEQIGLGNRVAPPAYVASNQQSYGTHWSSSGYRSTQGQQGYGVPQAQSHESQLPHHRPSFGTSHVQNNNSFYRYNPGYRPSNGLQGYDAPHGDSETVSSQDHQETTTPEDQQQVAFVKA